MTSLLNESCVDYKKQPFWEQRTWLLYAKRHLGDGGGGERRCSSYSFLTSAVDGSEWSASRLGRVLAPGKDTHIRWIRGWVGPRAGRNAEARRKVILSLPRIEHRSCSPWSHTVLTELPRLFDLNEHFINLKCSYFWKLHSSLTLAHGPISCNILQFCILFRLQIKSGINFYRWHDYLSGNLEILLSEVSARKHLPTLSRRQIIKLFRGIILKTYAV
jgi:hypothetical protein